MTDNDQAPCCLMPNLVSRACGFDDETKYGAREGISAFAIYRDLNDGIVPSLIPQRLDVLKYVQAAWAVLLRSYTASDDVCFRVVEDQQGIQNTVYTANISHSTPVLSLMKANAAPDPQPNLSTGSTDRLPYNTGIYYNDSRSLLECLNEISIAVRVQYSATEGSNIIEICSNDRFLSRDQAEIIANNLVHLLSEIEAHLNGRIGDIRVCSDADFDCMTSWNKKLGDDFLSVESTVHEAILQKCHETPDAVAVSAWDGDMTYGELERLSAALAAQLIDLGVKPEDFVPLCFDKSKWVVVAVLGVLRSGAAFVLLETSHPPSWLRNICQSVSAAVVICAPELLSLANQLAHTAIPLVHSELDLYRSHHNVPCQPSNALYAVFTSGSTGSPKGVVIEHGPFYCSTKRTATALAIGPSTRRLQFASHAFTMCNREILTTLMVGGCLCIPSAQERIYDVLGFINRHKVNYTYMTPSMAVLLSPEAAPGLKVLLLGGEAMGPSLLDKWVGKVKLLYGYGASETSGVAILASDIGPGWDPHNLGFVRDSALWVTEIDNPHRLAPIGAVGELLIQGRGLARHYLGDEERNRRVFLDGTEWLNDARNCRLYRTGDLVRYNVDGSIYYIGRKDRQIKLNGQLVDLGHVEHRVQRSLELLALEVQSSAVIATPTGSESSKKHQLVAILGHRPQLEQDEQEMSITDLDDAFPGRTADLEKELARHLPQYMIPTHFVFCKDMPMTKSGKMNRLKLKELVVESLADTGPEQELGSWKNKEEYALSEAWAQTLGVQPLQTDDFFRKGGDSIAAVQLISRLREEGITLNVVDIFRERTFAGMATALKVITATGMVESVPPPFSLYTADISLMTAITEELGVDMSLIEDLYPCTPMQEALVASSIKDPGASIAHHAWTLPEKVNINRFKEAWATVWKSNPVLRSRIGRVGSRMLQVVTQTDMPWQTVDSIDELEPLSSEQGPLVRFAIKSGPHPSFHIIIHHAIFDAWSLSLVCEQVQHAYHGADIPAHAFSPFIPYLRQNAGPASVQFWRRELAGFKGRHFPELPLDTMTLKKSLMTVTHPVEAKLAVEQDFTTASFLRLAWAIVLAQETGCPDVVFGAIVAGRGATIPGISKLSGPTLALVPVRVQLNPADVIKQSLQKIEEQSSRMIVYEQTGLQHITKCGDDVASASSFQNVMVIQPRQRMESMRSGLFAHPVARGEDYLLPFTSHPLLLVCQLGEETLSLQASFDSSVLSPDHAQRLLRQLAHTFKQLIAGRQNTIAGVPILPVEDQEQIKQWNRHVSSSSDATIVDLVLRRCHTQPDSVAVCGSDGSLTYHDLDRCSANLAAWLRLRGVGRGQYVPLMFNKSPWVAIAMLAVLRTGAAFVMLPPSYPLERLRSLVSQTKANLIVASPACAKASRQLSENIIILDSETTGHRPEKHQYSSIPPYSGPTPHDLAYIVFTSGSTGEPKGIMLHHSAVTTGILERCQGLQLDADSRVFQFASYAFDVAINDTLMGLVAGACICTPTESELQNEPSKAAFQLRANWAMVTPSMIRLLDPAVASTLRTFVVGGEALTTDIVRLWERHVNIIQIYGPAECTVMSTIRPNVTSASEPRDIGKAVQSASWIVDPYDHDRLQPIGMVGELLIQGPTVGLGYLNNLEKTTAAFCPPPTWLAEMSAPGSSIAVYKTGDLVQYGSDGSLIFVGRKDLQVKFRGQRLDPGEVESHIMSLIPDIKEVAVEMVTFRAQGARESLAAFICPGYGIRWGASESSNEKLNLITPGGSFYDDILKVSSQLSERLPPYMVPSMFIPLERMPLTLTVKVNHTLLREEVATWSPEMTGAYQPRTGLQAPRRSPKTARDECIHRIACSILNREGQNVSMDHDFFQLGGDSITATLFVLAAKREGIRIFVDDIFRHKTLAQLAEEQNNAALERSHCKDTGHNQGPAEFAKLQRLVSKILNLKESQITANSNFFDLGGDSITTFELVVKAKKDGIFLTEQSVFDNPKISDLASVATTSAGKSSNNSPQTLVSVPEETLRRQLPTDVFQRLVEVLPTTQFQRLSNSSMNYRYYRISLPSGFNKSKLLWACQQLIDRHAILRTGFIRLGSGEEVQLVLQHREVAVPEYRVDDLDAHCRHDATVADSQDCGRPPFQVQLVTLSDGRVFVVFRLGHALFDGLSIRLIGEDMSSLYSGQNLLETNPLSVHLRATRALRTEAAFSTWRRVLDGSQVTMLDGERLPVNEQMILRDEPAYLVKVEKQIAPVSPPAGVTLSTLLKAAWATTLAELFTPHDTSVGAIGQSANPTVVFGQVVHGRGVGVPHEDRILGPCISIIPVRVDVDHTAPRANLLRQIQQQMVETMPYSTMGFDDIRDNCTPWPKSTNLPSFLRIRNYQFTPPCWFEGVPCEATHYGIPNKPSPAANVHVVPSKTELHVDITLSSHVLGPRQVAYIVDHFCKTIQSFNTGVRSE